MIHIRVSDLYSELVPALKALGIHEYLQEAIHSMWISRCSDCDIGVPNCKLRGRYYERKYYLCHHDQMPAIAQRSVGTNDEVTHQRN